jgi:TolB-like protein
MEHVGHVESIQHADTSCTASLFGRFKLYAADGREIAIPSRRAKTLLAMLCLARGEAFDRNFLSKLMWPGRFEAHAKASLRQCLMDLGRLLAPYGPNILEVSRNSVALRSGSIATDLGMLEDMLARGDYTGATAQLAAIGNRPILDQMDLGDRFNEWLDRHRAEVETRLRVAIEDNLARLLRDGDEVGHAALIQTSYLRYSPVPVTSIAAEATSKIRLAVLPFQFGGEREEQGYFADGMVDELITVMGQVPQLLVSGRTSSFHFRGSDLSPAAIATKLGVSHLIEGSMQRQGDRVRVHTHLIAGDTGVELWGGRFDGTLDDIFAFQERVAQAIAGAIGEALGVDIQPPLVRGMTHSKQAYDLYLQARSLSFRLFGDGVLEKAIELLEVAVGFDPQFAEAWLLMAEVHQLVAIYSACLDRAAESARMARCVEKALAIKPGLGQAYSLLGLHQLSQNDFVGALDLAYKGYAMERNNPQVAMRLGSYLMFCGRTNDGMEYIEEAIAQDPIDGRKYMLRCVGKLNRGDIAGAIADGQRAVDLGFSSVHLAVATAASGQHDLAVEQYQLTRLLLNKSIFPPAGTKPMTPEVMDAYWLLAAKGVCSGVADDRETYCRTLDYLHMTMHDNGDYAITLPTVFMGYADMLFKTLGQRITPGNIGCLMSIWADIDPIRQIWQHPEFIPFAHRIGMARAWDKYGWPDLLPVPSNRA